MCNIEQSAIWQQRKVTCSSVRKIRVAESSLVRRETLDQSLQHFLAVSILRFETRLWAASQNERALNFVIQTLECMTLPLRLSCSLFSVDTVLDQRAGSWHQFWWINLARWYLQTIHKAGSHDKGLDLRSCLSCSTDSCPNVDVDDIVKCAADNRSNNVWPVLYVWWEAACVTEHRVRCRSQSHQKHNLQIHHLIQLSAHLLNRSCCLPQSHVIPL